MKTVNNRAFYYLVMSIALSIIMPLPKIASAQISEEALAWSIQTEKNTYFPGEPVLLILYVKNTMNRDEQVYLGPDSIEAFKIRIYDPNENLICRCKEIQRDGLTMKSPLIELSPGATAKHKFVLNRWCSTLLSSGAYNIVCDVKYLLFSERQKRPNTRLLKTGPYHQIRLASEIHIVEMDQVKFAEILRALADYEDQKPTQTKAEWFKEREIAREMITFAELDLAVPYQLRLLRVEQYTWGKRDLIDSLVKSGAPEAAGGLAQLYEDILYRQEDIRNDVVKAIHKLRETGKPEILAITEDFAEKYRER